MNGIGKLFTSLARSSCLRYDNFPTLTETTESAHVRPLHFRWNWFLSDCRMLINLAFQMNNHEFIDSLSTDKRQFLWTFCAVVGRPVNLYETIKKNFSCCFFLMTWMKIYSSIDNVVRYTLYTTHWRERERNGNWERKWKSYVFLVFIVCHRDTERVTLSIS